jgi:cytochrome c553
VDEVLRRCHAMMRAERRLLTDDDIRGIAASARPAPAAAGSPPSS